MAKVSPGLTNFNAGEWGPLTYGRVGIDKYGNSLRECTNWIPTIQGPLRKRPGTLFKAHPFQIIEEEPAPPTAVQNKYVSGILIPYRRSRTVNKMLVMGEDGDIFILNDDGTFTGDFIQSPVSFPASYDDQRKIQTCQDKEFLYIFVEDQPTFVFTYDGTTATYDIAEFNFGPIQSENITSTTIQSNISTGSCTLTASAPIFTADMAPVNGDTTNNSGQLIAFRTIVESLNPEWTAGQAVNIGDRRWGESYESPGRVNTYIAKNSATTGSFRPGHDFGTESDGNVDWEMIHDAYGYVRVTSYTSPTQVDGVVVGNVQLPSNVVTDGTIRWSFGSWSEEFGFPRVGVFHQGRLVCGDTDTQPLTIWGSAVNAPSDFYLDQAADDDAYEYTMSAEEGGRISFMESTRNLVVGSEIGIFVARATAGGPITPSDIVIDRDVKFGAEVQEAISVGNNVLFVQSGKGTCRELAYDFDSDGYVGNDLNLFTHHFGLNSFNDIAWTLEPDAIMWTYDDDGLLRAMTYEKRQNILGWHKHEIGGEHGASGTPARKSWGAIRSMASIPSTDGKADNLWMVVERIFDPDVSPHYSIEIMSQEDLVGTDPVDQVWSDSSITYDGVATTTITGLGHLEGAEVSITAEGAVHPSKTVSGGSVTLDYEAEKVVVGLPYESRAQTQDIEAGSQNGVSQGKQKRISNVRFRVYNARPGLEVSSTGDNYEKVILRSTLDNMDEAVPFFTGDTQLTSLLGSWSDGSQVYFKHNLPQACTVVALWPQLDTNDDR